MAGRFKYFFTAMEREYPERWPTEVEIVTTKGQKLRKRIDYPKGDPENPMSLNEMIEKYKDLARRRTSDFATELILERVMKLEKLLDMNILFEGLHSAGDGDAGFQSLSYNRYFGSAPLIY